MKKIKMLAAGLVLSSLFVSSCGPSTAETGFNKVNASLIDQNLLEVDVPLFQSEDDYTTHEFSIDAGLEIDESYYNRGLIVAKDSDNSGVEPIETTYFYSLITGKRVGDTNGFTDVLNYEVTGSSYGGFYLAIYTIDHLYVYDGFNNELVNKEGEDFVFTTLIQEETFLEKDYTVLQYQDNATGERFVDVFEYSIGKTPVALSDSNLLEHFTSNERLVDGSDYGLDGYLIKVESIDSDHYSIRLMTKDFNNVSLIYVNVNGAKSSFVIGEKLYLQYLNELPIYADDYDLYIGNLPGSSSNVYSKAKYELKTTCIDLLSGSRADVNLNYIVASGGLFSKATIKNSDGKSPLLLTDILKISEKKSLETNPVNVILDKNGGIVDELYGQDITHFIKLGNDGYFNTSNDYLYDKELRFVKDLSALNPQYVSELNCFIVNLEGKTALMDANCNVLNDTYLNGDYIAQTANGDSIYFVSSDEVALHTLNNDSFASKTACDLDEETMYQGSYLNFAGVVTTTKNDVSYSVETEFTLYGADGRVVKTFDVSLSSYNYATAFDNSDYVNFLAVKEVTLDDSTMQRTTKYTSFVYQAGQQVE